MRGTQAWAGLRLLVVLGCIVTAMVWAGVSTAAAPAGSEQATQPAAGVPQPAPTQPTTVPLATAAPNALGANARLLTDSEKSTFDAVLTSHQTLMTTLTWATGIVSAVIVATAAVFALLVGRIISDLTKEQRSELYERSNALTLAIDSLQENIGDRINIAASEKSSVSANLLREFQENLTKIDQEAKQWTERTKKYEELGASADKENDLGGSRSRSD